MHKEVKIQPSSIGPPDSNSFDKSSVISIVCRICYDGDKEESIITPCHCKGTVAFVHRSCLETWLAESNTTACELCHHTYVTERVPKYRVTESIWRWVKHQPSVGFEMRGLKSDILGCTILTPLILVITYVCIFSADYYNQKRFASMPATKWTSISLLVMIVIMIIGYFIWVYMVIRYHAKLWYYCWQRECVVTYIPPVSQIISNNPVTTTAVVTLEPNTSSLTSVENFQEVITVT